MPPQQASILIVDDELSVRDSLLHWFRKDGFNVATAASATLALAEALDARLQFHAIHAGHLDVEQDDVVGTEDVSINRSRHQIHRCFDPPG
jgi:CheY-like chemotaxis protein